MLGDQLKKYRIQHNMSQQDLALLRSGEGKTLSLF